MARSPRNLSPVGITRKQMLSLNLPLSLSKKQHKAKEMERFEAETGGREFAELDAVETEDLCRFLEEKIKPFAKLDEDEKQTEALQKKCDQWADDATPKLQEIDWAEEEQGYDALQEELSELNEKLEDIREDWDAWRERRERLNDWMDAVIENALPPAPDEDAEKLEVETEADADVDADADADAEDDAEDDADGEDADAD